jgi:H+-transporting ATPase
MQAAMNKPEAEPQRSMPSAGKKPDIASLPLPDTLAALHVDPETGLTHGEVEARRKEHGYNEVAEQKEHPVLSRDPSGTSPHPRSTTLWRWCS